MFGSDLTETLDRNVSKVVGSRLKVADFVSVISQVVSVQYSRVSSSTFGC